MKLKEFLAMVTLSAMWGASFLFMKISSPEMGAILTANLRVFIATITLTLICIINRHKLDYVKNYKKYLILGALNAAIPFAFICTAELHIDASLAAILNATTPTFTAIVALFWNKEKFTPQKIIALILGFIGVIILVGWNGINDIKILFFALFSLLAAVAYGFGGVFSSKAFKDIDPIKLAFGQQLSASIILLPFSIFSLPSKMPSSKAIISVVLLAVFCTAIAYLVYFYLIKNIGAVKASLVTFLVPVFGIVWGSLFLQEAITVQNVIGLLIIIIGILSMSDKISFKLSSKKHVHYDTNNDKKVV